ncbi:hypothetical protein Btru_052741 [Bulinus truncatus]|nr:hypothetical protein Btru_052741 [Bulinus truncatus]
MVRLIYWKAFLMACVLMGGATCYIMGDRQLDVVYKDLGDLNVRGLFSASTYDDSAACGQKLSRNIMFVVRLMEILAYAVRNVNSNSTLLPGIKLGFVFLDFCSNIHAAMVQASRLLPRSDPSDYVPTSQSNYLTSFKVVGVLGTSLTHVTLPISVLFSGAGMPVLSFSDPSEDFTLKNVHSTSMYLSSQKYHVVDAMVSYLVYNDWRYVSVVLDNHEPMLDYIRQRMKDANVCIAMTRTVALSSDYNEVIHSLLAVKAKVVLVFITVETANNFVMSMETERIDGQLTWLLTDSWMHLMQIDRLVNGALIFSSTPLGLLGFSLNLTTLRMNPWFKKNLEQERCEGESCISYKILKMSSLLTLTEGHIYDAMMAYAHGLHNMIRDKCPGAEGAEATSCFDEHKPLFVDYVKNVTFQGVSGRVVHSAHGNKLQQDEITIYQNKLSEGEGGETTPLITKQATFKLATYYVKSRALDVIRNVSMAWADFPMNMTHIGTVCRPKCSPSQYRKQRTLCCWACFPCQDDERVSLNETACEKCPRLEWPAMQGGKLSVCRKIKMTVFTFYELGTVAVVVAGTMGLVVSLTVIVMLCLDGSTRSKETPMALLLLELVALIGGFASVPFFLMVPDLYSCNLAHVLFILSFSVQYTALLLYSLNVYRKCVQIVDESDLRMTSTINQITFTVCMFCLEVGVFSFFFIAYPVRTLKNQPYVGVNFVEFVCDISDTHIVIFLLFSILLLMLCSIFSFKSQNDEVRARETRHVSTFVIVALIMWVSFMPAYFTADLLRMRTYLRIIAVLVNHSAALLLNFTPRAVSSLFIRQRADTVTLFDFRRASKAIRKMTSSFVDEKPVVEVKQPEPAKVAATTPQPGSPKNSSGMAQLEPEVDGLAREPDIRLQ